MFSHPVSVFGYIAIGVGVVVMTMGGALTALGYLIAGLGPFLILIGVIAQGFLRLEQLLKPQQDVAVAAPTSPKPEVDTRSDESLSYQELMQRAADNRKARR